MKPKSKAIVGIRVSVPLVQQIIKRMNWSPAMPFNFAVDSALRELLKRLEEKGEGLPDQFSGEKKAEK